MKTMKHAVFQNAVAKANAWISEIANRLKHNDKAEALRALRVVLHALRDRLSIEEAIQLSAQLPLVIRGLYFDGWSPFDAVGSEGGLDSFFAEITEHLPSMTEPERMRAVRVVFDVLAHHISAGEVEDITAVLPASLKQFWSAAVAD